MHSLIILHCLTLVCLTFVKADFYTTSPISDTVWIPGQDVKISWIDGKNPPSLSTIKKAKIYLCTGSDTNQSCPNELATIDPVTPEGGSTTVKVPDGLAAGKVWFLKYTADNGQSFWSTRFTVDSSGVGGKSSDAKSPSSDSKSPDGKSPDGKGPDGKSPDGKGPDGKSPDGKSPDGKSSDGKGPNGQGSSTSNGANNSGKGSNNGDSKSNNSTTDNKTSNSDNNSSTTSGTFNLGNSQYSTTAMLVVSTLSVAWMW